MRNFKTTIDEAEDEIVFALKKKTDSALVRRSPQDQKQPVRQPAPIENCDLEAAIDDMLARFPKTLEYLAK